MNYKLKKILRFLFNYLITKKMLVIIIAILLLLFLKSNVFAVSSLPSNTPTTTIEVTCNVPTSRHYGTTFNLVLPTAWLSYFDNYNNFLYTGWDLNGSDNRFYIPDTSLNGYVYINSNNSLSYSNCYVINHSGSWNLYAPNESIAGTPGKQILNYSTIDIYSDVNKTSKFFIAPIVEPIFPSILDTDVNLTALNMNYITVDSGDQNLLGLQFHIATGVVGSEEFTEVYTTTLNEDSPFYNSGGTNGDYYEIPVSLFKGRLIDGYELRYYLFYHTDKTEGVYYRPVIYTPAVGEMTDTEQIQNTIQNNFNILNNNLQNSLNQQTNSIVNSITGVSNRIHELMQQNSQILTSSEETKNFLQSQNFDNSNLGLPTSNQQDITQDGINNIFTMIYNSFTSGQAPDVVVPIPFTGKSFTIQANFLRNILNGTSFSFISNIIELFWWYIISKFIITDIANKMNKIKSGDFENLENSNIKEDML